MRTVHIEKKALPEAVVMETARRALMGRLDVWLTPSDLAVATGLPLTDAEAALLHLSTRHPSRLGVTDDGTFTMRFLALSHTRPSETWWTRARAWLAGRRDPILAVVTLLLAPVVCVMGMAGSYGLVAGVELNKDIPQALATALMVLGGLAAILWVFATIAVMTGAAVAAAVPALLVAPIVLGLRPLFDPPKDPDFSVGRHVGVALLGTTIMWIMAWQLARFVRGFWKKVIAGQAARWAPRLWRSFGGLLVGPPAEEVDALHDERRLVERIRELAGVVTTADLVGLFGWTPERADSEIVRVMMDYGGDVTVTDDGSILWVFPALGARGPRGVIEEVGATANAPEVLLAPAVEGASATPRAAAPAPVEAVFRAELGEAPRYLGCTRRFAIVVAFVLVPSALGPLVHPELVALPTLSQMFVHAPVGRPSDPLMQAFGIWPAFIVAAACLARVPAHLLRRARWRRWGRTLAAARAFCASPESARALAAAAARRGA